MPKLKKQNRENGEMKQVSLKKALEVLGFTEVKVHNGFNFQTAFGKDKNGDIWYADTGDWRWRSSNGTLIRRAESYTDYIDKTNEFWLDRKLEEHGYQLKPKFSRNG